MRKYRALGLKTGSRIDWWWVIALRRISGMRGARCEVVAMLEVQINGTVEADAAASM